MLALVAWPLVACAAAGAQQTEYRLDESGEWVQTSAPEPGSDAARIAEARRLLAEEKPGRARRLLSEWIEEHKFTDSPFLADAYVLRGDAKTMDGDEYQALYDYELVAKEFQGSTAFVRALEREMEIAIRYLGGMKRRWLGMRIFGAKGEGEELLVRVQERMPGSALAERAGFELIRYYYRKRDLVMAAEMSSVFMHNFPRSQYRVRALEYRIKSNVGLFAGPEYDGAYLIEARLLIKLFVDDFPAEAERTGMGDAMLARLDESAAAQLLVNARWYLRQGDEAAARYTLAHLVRQHGLTVSASRAYQMMTERGWAGSVEAPGAVDESWLEEPADGAAPEGAGGTP
jgi:hypothetical protein